MDEQGVATKPKKERSPSFPFISLRKAVERATALYEGHRRESARLSAIAPTWGYSAKSSGALQTVAALKQFNLIEDSGSGEERKVSLSKLAHTIIADSRPGARDDAIKQAARNPALIAEYIPRWVPHRPSDAHCISELHLDRGFTEEAAKTFIRVFDDTVSFADLSNDELNSSDTIDATLLRQDDSEPQQQSERKSRSNKPRPLRERLQVTSDSQSLAITATLESEDEADLLINLIKANKALLPRATENAAPKDEAWG